MGGREEEQSWNQVLHLEGTGTLSLKKRRHEGNILELAGLLAKTKHVLVARVPAGARFGDYSDQQKQIKSILSLPGGSLLERD